MSDVLSGNRCMSAVRERIEPASAVRLLHDAVDALHEVDRTGVAGMVLRPEQQEASGGRGIRRRLLATSDAGRPRKAGVVRAELIVGDQHERRFRVRSR
jgi:hypothetical protein